MCGAERPIDTPVQPGQRPRDSEHKQRRGLQFHELLRARIAHGGKFQDKYFELRYQGMRELLAREQDELHQLPRGCEY